jgi:hypothetical protein
MQSMLPDELARTVDSTVSAGKKLRQAKGAVAKGDLRIFARMYRDYQAADASTRLLMQDQLPVMLAQAADLGKALRGCPSDVVAAFCHKLEGWLAPHKADAHFAARVFMVITDPDLQASQPETVEQLVVAFEQVREWRGRDLNAIPQFLPADQATVDIFRDWRDSHRGGAFRKFFRRALGAVEDS